MTDKTQTPASSRQAAALDAASAALPPSATPTAPCAALGPQVPVWLRDGDAIISPAGAGFVVRIVEDNRPEGGVGLGEEAFTGDDGGPDCNPRADAAAKALRYIAEDLGVERQKRRGGVEIDYRPQGREADE